VLYYFLKKRTGGEDVDLDLEEATAAANTPLVQGVVASARGGPAKRGRGSRGPRNPPGQNKRERKVNSVKSYLYYYRSYCTLLDSTLCSHVGDYQCFGCPYCLYLQSRCE
jgi:hypothetical protein